jgi:molybdate transport system substrate-binding protein
MSAVGGGFLSAAVTCLVLALSMRASAPPPPRLTVAAAADLSVPLRQIARAFEQQSGATVGISLGGSGNLATQIENGAPYDVFLSADLDYPRKLIAAHAADPDLRAYALGRLVLWLPARSKLDPERHGLRVLLDRAVEKIAIANPQHAPYGRAAVAALRHFQLYDKLAAHLVLGENVSQAAQFVESGNAQAGLLALSHALSPGLAEQGRYWLVPTDAYPALTQGAVIVSRSPQKQLAAGFLDFLQSPASQEVMRRFGFSQPEGAH